MVSLGVGIVWPLFPSIATYLTGVRISVFEFFYEARVANNATDFCLGSLGRFQISWFLVNGSHFGEMGQLGFRPELMDIGEVCSPNLMLFLIALGYVLTDRFKQAEKPRPRPFLVLPRYDR
jgi:hypothetical protein